MAAKDILVSPRTSYVAVLFWALALVAFWPPYISKWPGNDELYVDLHAAGVLAWLALLIAQPILIRTRRRPLHRRLGAVSYVLVPYIVATSLLLSHSRLDPVSAPTFRADATDNYLALVAIVLFTSCYGLAIAYRRNAALHARFMTATLLSLIDPLTFRLLYYYTPLKDQAPNLPIVGFGLADLILVGLLLVDRNHPVGRKAWPLLLAIFVPAHLGYFTLARTDLWAGWMAAFKSLPIG